MPTLDFDTYRLALAPDVDVERLRRDFSSAVKRARKSLPFYLRCFGWMLPDPNEFLMWREEYGRRHLAILDSMTADERHRVWPVSERSRQRRIAKGAGVAVREVRKLYQLVCKMDRMMGERL